VRCVALLLSFLWVHSSCIRFFLCSECTVRVFDSVFVVSVLCVFASFFVASALFVSLLQSLSCVYSSFLLIIYALRASCIALLFVVVSVQFVYLILYLVRVYISCLCFFRRCQCTVFICICLRCGCTVCLCDSLFVASLQRYFVSFCVVTAQFVSLLLSLLRVYCASVILSAL